MNTITTALRTALEQVVELGPQLIAASIVLLICVGIGRTLARGLSRTLDRGGAGARHPRMLSRAIRIGFFLMGLILALQVLGLTAVATSLLATGGLVAVIIGFAVREIGENLLAGIFLGISRSFEVGDLVESSGYHGKVKRIEVRQVWIRSADGRDIFIPSAQVFRNPLINYTRDSLRRGEFSIGIDYADPIPEARDLIVTEAKKVQHVLAEPGVAARISEFMPQYCELKVVFWVNTSQGPGLAEVRSMVMAACLKALREHGFTLSSDVSTAVSISPREALPSTEGSRPR